MNLAGNEVDVSVYDEVHKTDSTPGVMTAAKCIELLKEKIHAQNAEKNKEKTQRAFVEEQLKKALSTSDEINFTVVYNKITIWCGLIGLGASLNEEEPIPQLFDIFSGPESEHYLAQIKVQYDSVKQNSKIGFFPSVSITINGQAGLSNNAGQSNSQNNFNS